MSRACHYPSLLALSIIVCSGCGAGHVGDPPRSSGTLASESSNGGSEPSTRPPSGGGGGDAGGAANDTLAPDLDNSCSASGLSQLFEQRIRPLVQKGAPTTCNKCHLAGVDLSMFVQPSACASMACLMQKGLVDLADPASSRILGFISKGQPASSLITGAVRQKEYQGFLDWIRWSARCQASACGQIVDPCGGAGASQTPPPDPTPMLGGCSEAALLSSFQQQVNRWRGRCESCHAPNGANKTKGTLWLPDSADNAMAAMYNLIGLGALDVNNPAASRLITKPLDEALGGVVHGGGPKIKSKSEQTYIDYLAWATRYANCYKQAP